LFGFYFWLNQRIDNVIDKETYDYLVEKIKTSEDLPDRFYKIYGQVTGYDEKSTTNKYLFYLLVRDRRMFSYSCPCPCPCIHVGYHIVYNPIDKWTLGFVLDRDVLPKKCLDFYLSKFDFLHDIEGIRNASQFYYQKDLEQLSDDEMFELSVMTINPSYYNKIRRPEELKEKVEKIKMNKK
jgi:hypothetical protein